MNDRQNRNEEDEIFDFIFSPEIGEMILKELKRDYIVITNPEKYSAAKKSLSKFVSVIRKHHPGVPVKEDLVPSPYSGGTEGAWQMTLPYPEKAVDGREIVEILRHFPIHSCINYDPRTDGKIDLYLTYPGAFYNVIENSDGLEEEYGFFSREARERDLRTMYYLEQLDPTPDYSDKLPARITEFIRFLEIAYLQALCRADEPSPDSLPEFTIEIADQTVFFAADVSAIYGLLLYGDDIAPVLKNAPERFSVSFTPNPYTEPEPFERFFVTVSIPIFEKGW